MKKLYACATCLLFLSACYTPLNNSGVATTQKWLEIAATRTDFDGKQYDSCYRFDIRFWPQEAAQALDLQESCISACCWRNEKPSVTLDFNKNFKQNLARYGKAYYYEPGQITLSVTHSRLVNTTRVAIAPRGSISHNGLVKLKYKLVEDPARQAQLKEQEEQAAAERAARARLKAEQAAQNARQAAQARRAQKLLIQQVGAAIDGYLYRVNKTYKQKGWIFLISDRLFTPVQTGADQWKITCHTRVQKGKTAFQLTKATFTCGTWAVNTATDTIKPLNKKARLINSAR